MPPRMRGCMRCTRAHAHSIWVGAETGNPGTERQQFVAFGARGFRTSITAWTPNRLAADGCPLRAVLTADIWALALGAIIFNESLQVLLLCLVVPRRRRCILLVTLTRFCCCKRQTVCILCVSCILESSCSATARMHAAHSHLAPPPAVAIPRGLCAHRMRHCYVRAPPPPPTQPLHPEQHSQNRTEHTTPTVTTQPGAVYEPLPRQVAVDSAGLCPVARAATIATRWCTAWGRRTSTCVSPSARGKVFVLVQIIRKKSVCGLGE